MLAFRSMCAKRGVPKTAYATIKGVAGMRMVKEGPIRFMDQDSGELPLE